MVSDDPESFADLDGHQDPAPGHPGLSDIPKTMNPADAQKAQNTPQYEQANVNNQKEVELTNVTYNETSGFRANPKAEPGAADSTEQVHEARVAVAEVANRILDSNHPEREQAPNDLTSRTVHDLNGGNKDIIVAHNDALHATREAMGGSNTTNGAMHFRTGTHKFKSLYGNKATMSFGPFRNAQGGKVYLTVAP